MKCFTAVKIKRYTACQMIQGLDGSHPQVFCLHDITLWWTNFQVKSYGLSQFSMQAFFFCVFFFINLCFAAGRTTSVGHWLSDCRQPLLLSSSEPHQGVCEGDLYLCLPFASFPSQECVMWPRHVQAGCMFPFRCTLTSPANAELCSCPLLCFTLKVEKRKSMTKVME